METVETDTTKQLIKAGATTVINDLGASIFNYALSLKLLQVTGSAMGYGTSLIIGPLVGVLVAPWVGNTVDRYQRKNIALIAEGTLILTLIVYFLFFEMFHTNILISAIIVVCLNNITARFFTISYLSSTPQIVSGKHIQKLNSIESTAATVSSILAPAIAGFLFGIIDFKWMIILQIITEGITLILTIVTHFEDNPIAKSKNKIDRLNIFKSLNKYPTVLFFLIVTMCLNITSTALVIGMPYVVIHTLKYSTTISGNIEGIYSVGALIGGIIITIINLKNIFGFIRNMYWASSIQLFILGLMLFFMPHYVLFIFLFFEFVIGVIDSVSQPPMFTYIQKVVPEEDLGKVNTSIYTAAQILTPIAVFIFSIVFAKVNYRIVFLANGVVSLFLTFFLLEIVGKKVIKK
ncbi:MFS transporter [Companilactobacillus suantsaicola]|nr:MFS transporter [Companilactobacillus suantsaicola]